MLLRNVQPDQKVNISSFEQEEPTQTNKTWTTENIKREYYELREFTKHLNYKCATHFKVSSSSENDAKNRFYGVLALDQTRVLLENSDPDYINANFVSSPLRKKQYIACQAPPTNCFADFWTMVWQQNVTVITMLTSKLL
eukprot:TRINITY_DN5156_c0_g1_i1.p1 TRINITY_DN5156_c0_g1~~TRINITY_DN5156_c0_g1_i1.p1  ORF type:complete len:140 (-),score=25.06 TRINITY_DN5156_c0_g1_i1:66-485(-)